LKKLVRPFLDDILEAIDAIEAGIVGKSLDDYSRNWILRRGVERGVEIISEASRRIPEELRNQQPEIPWKRILGIGNVLRHDYRHVSIEVIYDVAKKDLVPLRSAILAIEAGLDEPEE
jgi:uncharacterized protein with HEPN domain